MALPRIQRLTNQADFLRISRQGRTVADSFLSLRYTPATASNGRAAVVISSKAIPLATKRNQLRRVITVWLSERWRHNPNCGFDPVRGLARAQRGLEGLGRATPNGIDLVVGVKSDCAKLKSDQIRVSLEQLFRKANLV